MPKETDCDKRYDSHGPKDDMHFTNYHRVLNSAKWSARLAAKILIPLIIPIFPEGWPLIIAVDETIERRKGKKITAKGCYRDAVKFQGRFA